MGFAPPSGPTNGGQCQRCGWQVAQADAFCANCGLTVPPAFVPPTPVQPPQPAYVPPTPVQPPQSAYVPPVAGQYAAPSAYVPPTPGQYPPQPPYWATQQGAPPARGGNGLVLAAIGGVLVICLAAAGLFVLSQSHGGTQSTATPSLAALSSKPAATLTAVPTDVATEEPTEATATDTPPAPSGPGEVVFGTDIPTANSKCQPKSPVTSASATTSVYATYVFGPRPGTETISLEVTKDGATFIARVAMPTVDTKGLDCFGDTTDLSQLPGWGPGTFVFLLTTGGSELGRGELVVF